MVFGNGGKALTMQLIGVRGGGGKAAMQQQAVAKAGASAPDRLETLSLVTALPCLFWHKALMMW